MAAMASCPICQSKVARDGGTFPFCSSRCRAADLGTWLGGAYRIADPDMGMDGFGLQEMNAVLNSGEVGSQENKAGKNR